MKKLLPLVALLVLSGCDLGKGSKLESLEIVDVNGVSITGSYTMYQCFRDRLNVVGRFTEGDLGNFSTRASWSSSNPAVVRVLNLNEQKTRAVISGKFDDINNSFYTPGVLVPMGPGTATITASFIGLSASVNVTVRAPTLSATPSPVVQRTDPMPASAPTGLNFARAFTVRTVLDKGQVIDAVQRRQDAVTLELLNPILWQFTDNDPTLTPSTTDPAIDTNSFRSGNTAATASLDREDLNLFPAGSTRTTTEPLVAGTESATLNPASGVLRAVSATNPNPSVRALFDTDPVLGVSCPTPTLALPAPLAAVNSLAISHETDFNGVGAATTGDLVVGTDEILRVTANLAGGLTQDVSSQVGFEVIQADRDACVGTTDCTQAANRTSSILSFSLNQMTTVPGTTGSFCSSRTVANASGVARFDSCDTVVDAVNIRACAPTCSSTTITATSDNNSVGNFPVRVIPATLTAFGSVTSPTAAEQTFTFPGQQFSVAATFTASTTNTFAGNATSGLQNVTRYMNWVARPSGSTTTGSNLFSLFGLYGTTSGQAYYLRNPDATTTPPLAGANASLDITATPVTSTRIGSFANAGTLTAPTLKVFTVTPAP